MRVLEKVREKYRVSEDELSDGERALLDRLVKDGLVQKYGIYYQLTTKGYDYLEGTKNGVQTTKAVEDTLREVDRIVERLQGLPVITNEDLYRVIEEVTGARDDETKKKWLELLEVEGVITPVAKIEADDESALKRVVEAYKWLKKHGGLPVAELVDKFGADVLEALKRKGLVTFTFVGNEEYVQAK